jgi:hypothetical protein
MRSASCPGLASQTAAGAARKEFERVGVVQTLHVYVARQPRPTDARPGHEAGTFREDLITVSTSFRAPSCGRYRDLPAVQPFVHKCAVKLGKRIEIIRRP